jgi:hypothetical protein
VFELTHKEKHLLRKALDPVTPLPEAETAACLWIRALRKRKANAYAVEKVADSVERRIVSEYFANLGRKSKGTPQAHWRAQVAATARWTKTPRKSAR